MNYSKRQFCLSFNRPRFPVWSEQRRAGLSAILKQVVGAAILKVLAGETGSIVVGLYAVGRVMSEDTKK